MLPESDPQAIALPDGALAIDIEVDRPVVIALKRVGLNLSALPNEALHFLQDDMITKLRAREQRVLQVINK